MVTKSCDNTNIYRLRSDMWVFMNTAICKCDWRSTMLKVCLYKRIDWISFSIAHYKHTVCHRQSCKKLHHMQRAPRRNCIQTGHKLGVCLSSIWKTGHKLGVCLSNWAQVAFHLSTQSFFSTASTRFCRNRSNSSVMASFLWRDHDFVVDGKTLLLSR